MSMTVKGIEIPESVINACRTGMKSSSGFKASDIQSIAENAGLNSEVAMRVADRLIQIEKKNKNIELTSRRFVWAWVN